MGSVNAEAGSYFGTGAGVAGGTSLLLVSGSLRAGSVNSAVKLRCRPSGRPVRCASSLARCESPSQTIAVALVMPPAW